MTTTTEGNIQVVELTNQHKQANLRGCWLSWAGWVEGNASYYDHADRQRVYAEKPAMQMLFSGWNTCETDRVYFKLKRSAQTALEGIHEVELVFEVPMQWRGDLLEVNMEAFGRLTNHWS